MRFQLANVWLTTQSKGSPAASLCRKQHVPIEIVFVFFIGVSDATDVLR
jgi:hypothetical protein